MKNFIFSVLLIMLIGHVSASTITTEHTVPMHYNGTETYYVYADLAGIINSEFMVDTGSGYVVINQQSLDVLRKESKALYLKQVVGKMADGSQRKVSIWTVDEIKLGGICAIKNVEVAVFPGNQRQIIGLRALKRAAPLTFHFNPPSLSLGSCQRSSS